MTFTDEFEGLIALRDLLKKWDEDFACTVRVELRPRSKYSGEDLLGEDERPRLFLETIAFEVEQAVDAAQLVHSLRELSEGVTIHVHRDRIPERCPWWRRLIGG